MLASPSNNPTYLSLNFSNLKQLLRAVSINGIDIPRTRYGARRRARRLGAWNQHTLSCLSASPPLPCRRHVGAQRPGRRPAARAAV